MIMMERQGMDNKLGFRLEKNLDMVDKVDTNKENVQAVHDVQANSLLSYRNNELEIEDVDLDGGKNLGGGMKTYKNLKNRPVLEDVYAHE